ncbi:flagellar hook-length control protein FliK, partial [Geodermatophilus arenarius]
VAADPQPASVPAAALPVPAEAPAAPAAAPVPAAADPGAQERDPGTSGGTPLSAVPAPAPVPAPASATPAAAPARPDVPQPPVAAQVAPTVATLAAGPDGTHTMTLVLTPETLGPVEVRVTVHSGTVELSLRGASDAGRAALLDALPDLRRDLEASGLTCSRLQVDRDAAGSGSSQAQAGWQQAQQQAGEHGRGSAQGGAQGRGAADDRGRPWLRTPDTDGSRPAAAADHPASSVLDVRA